MRIQGQAFGDCQVMASSLGLSHHDVHLCREYRWVIYTTNGWNLAGVGTDP